MNKSIVGYLLIAILGTSSLMAGHKKKNKRAGEEPAQVLSFEEFALDAVDGFSKGKSQNYIVECPAGMQLPLKLSMSGDMFQVEPNDSIVNIKLLKPCYVKCTKKQGLLFSVDMEKWKEFDEFFSGSVSASLGVQDYYPLAKLELDLHHEENKLTFPIPAE